MWDGDGGDNCEYIEQTSDGGYVVCGSTNSYGPHFSFAAFVLKLTPSGTFDWVSYYSEENWDNWAICVRECANGDFIALGRADDGLFLWRIKQFTDFINLLGGIKIVDTIHVILFFFFMAFMVVHCYLATLGHTPLAHYKAMFTGFEEHHEH